MNKIDFFYVENKEARLKVVRTLNKVISVLTSCYCDVVSIILFGSLTRNEGIWKMEEKIKILSDLDLLIVIKRKKRSSEKLKRIIKEIEKSEEIGIDLKFVKYDDLKRLTKDTHNLDRKEGITIWGKDVTSNFPEFKNGDINIKDSIFLFFNRILLTIESFPGFNKDLNMKKWLSHEASKTMFTCADIIGLNFGSYHFSILKRVEFIKKHKEINIPKRELFLEDLNKVVSFRFKEINNPYIPNSYNCWLRSKDHLIRVFYFFCIKKKYKNLLSIMEKMFKLQLRSLYKSRHKTGFKTLLYSLCKLLRLGKIPKFPKKREQYFVDCRMTSLMLYMALGEEKKEDYLEKAKQYLSKVYYFSEEKKDWQNRWIFLRKELKKLYDIGIF